MGLLATSCDSTKDDEGEGDREDDVHDTAVWPGPPPGLPGQSWDNLPAISSGQEVCYPGEDSAYTTCLPLVDHSDEWGPAYAYPVPLDDSPFYRAPVRFLDLSTDEADPRLKLAPNFQLDEFMEEYKGRFGLFQVHAVESIQLMREAIGGPLYVNSAYRNVDYNAGVGGATWSRHLYGDAVDIRSDDASLDELAELCEDLGAGFTSVYTSHVHCDWRDDALDLAFYDAAVTAHLMEPASAAVVMEDERFTVTWTGFDEGTPQIQWTGFSAQGDVIADAQGPSWLPPSSVRWIEVDVGQAVVLREPIP